MPRYRARPDPISCQSCRSKKLRCNRVQPCSNCTARCITCKFIVPPPKGQTGSTSTAYGHVELLERVEQLEHLVLPQHTSENNHPKRRLGPTSDSEAAVGSGVYRKRDHDLQMLENIGTREDSLLLSLSKNLAFTISSTHEILETQPHLQSSNLFPGHKGSDHTVVKLPAYKTAVLLFENYEANVDHVCRILHNPTIRSLMRTFYLRINRNDSVHPGQAALLLSIFALSGFFYQPSDGSEVATTERDAVQLSKIWGKGALDALDHSHRDTSGTLEDIQATILMRYFTYHTDGFSARCRLLLALAISTARDLRLHRLDADDEPSLRPETSLRAFIDQEVKRRVFWHLASADWLQSTISGPQEGMYFIHPNHTNVRFPKDCDDDEIVLGEENKPTVGPQPTGMTFFLAKVRLAHICRELSDIVPLDTSKLLQMRYENIVALDRQLKDFLSNLPFFFQLDAESRQETKALEAVYPKIPIMRYCITAAAHSRRCKLHQKFLLRQSSDSRYAYSRHACLESARAVIQAYEDQRRDHDSPSTAMARMGMVVHFTHLAMVVMVMDLCFNKEDVGDGERNLEVQAALQMLEDARDVSPLLSRSLSSLREIMQRHNVFLPDLSASTTQYAARHAHETEPDGSDSYGDVFMQPTQLGLDTLDPSFGVDELWQFTAQSEANLDSVTWDNLFSALDSRPF